MAELDCTIIIAAPSYDAARPVLESLAAWPQGLHTFEIIVAAGSNPPRQRNIAVNRARGTYILFLDSDCMVDANSRLGVENLLSWEDFDLAGGPVLLPEGSGRRQSWFQAALSHPAVVGPTASRYASRGRRRKATERELILANLLVRRSLFEKIGPFQEGLYPNEENEWMDRLPEGMRIYCEPDMAVQRPQRETWAAFVWMLLRYGAGRVRQYRYDRRFNLKLLTPLSFVGWVITFAIYPLFVGSLTLLVALLYPLLLMLGRPRYLAGRHDWLMVGIAAATVLIAYGAGQALGWLGWPYHKRGGEPVALYDKDGNELE